MKRAVFEIKQNAVGRYYFVFKDTDGKLLIISKSFPDRSMLEICIAQVREKAKVAGIKENMDDIMQPPLFIINKDISGYAFTLIGFEGEVIFSSESYEQKSECLNSVELLKDLSFDAGIADYIYGKRRY